MLILSEDLLDQIAQHAVEGYPNEIVGVMAGRYEDENKRVTRLFRGQNQFSLAEDNGSAEALKEDLQVDGSAATRYFMTGEEMRAVDAACRAEGIDIIGFYHTHPDHPARPSITDLRFAQQTLPGYSYLIMAVEEGDPDLTTCWVLSDDESRFDEERITGA